jgi:hypothetical protein
MKKAGMSHGQPEVPYACALVVIHDQQLAVLMASKPNPAMAGKYADSRLVVVVHENERHLPYKRRNQVQVTVNFKAHR